MAPKVDPQAVLDVVTQYVLPIIGGVCGFALSVSPLKALQTVERRGKLGNMNPLPTCVFLCNCAIWLMYAAAIKDPFVFVANMPNVPVNLHIILRSYSYAAKRMRDQMEGILLASLFLLLSIGMFYVFDEKRALATRVNGIAAMLVNICLYASPLTSLGLVIRLRDSSSIYLPWTLTALACSSSWLIYALMTKQIPVIVPHSFGLVLCLLQLILRMALPANTRRTSNSSSSSSSSAPSCSSSSSHRHDSSNDCCDAGGGKTKLPSYKVKNGKKGGAAASTAASSSSSSSSSHRPASMSAVVVMNGGAGGAGAGSARAGGNNEIELSELGSSSSSATLSLSSSSIVSLMGNRVNSLTPLCEEENDDGSGAYDMGRMMDHDDDERHDIGWDVEGDQSGQQQEVAPSSGAEGKFHSAREEEEEEQQQVEITEEGKVYEHKDKPPSTTTTTATSTASTVANAAVAATAAIVSQLKKVSSATPLCAMDDEDDVDLS